VSYLLVWLNHLADQVAPYEERDLDAE